MGAAACRSRSEEEGFIEDDKQLHPLFLNLHKLIEKNSLEEIRTVVFQMAHNNSPGPDGITI